MIKSILSLFVCVPFFLFSNAQKKGSFKIQTTPAGAAIHIDGLPDIEKRTPCSFNDYLVMSYRVKIEKHNYQTIDTIVRCDQNEIHSYFFDLVPKEGSIEINTIPSGVSVFINEVFVGTSPLLNHSLPCGPNTIRLELNGQEVMNKTYVVDESMTLQLLKDFSQKSQAQENPVYSAPGLASPVTLEEELDFDYGSDNAEPYAEPQENKLGGFGSVGFFSMLGSNGVKGASIRYGADLFNVLRVFGESNADAKVSGAGVELVLPWDLQGVGLFAKVGVVSRRFKPNNYHDYLQVPFVNLGGGLMIKPSRHFQLFLEVEYSDFSEDALPEDIFDWNATYSSYNNVCGWVGIRAAF
jgi:hypothetical protein